MSSQPSSPPPAASTPEPAAAEPVVLVGVAHNAKLSAIVVGEGFSVYCIELEEWPDEVLGETVEITGHIERTDQYQATVNAKGEISQGTAGGDTVLRGLSWQLVAPGE